MAKTYKHLIGKRYSRFTFDGLAGYEGGYAVGRFTCDCGTVKVLRLYAVTSGNTRSCGCLKSQSSIATHTTHGLSQSPEYKSHSEMKKRCLNPKNHAYDRYGGRGITICDRWLGPDGFVNFFDDMGTKPSPRHSLDRIRNGEGYSPDNCRWALPTEQGNNRRSTRLLTIGERTMSHKQWATEFGVTRYMVTSRVDKGLSGSEIAAALIT